MPSDCRTTYGTSFWEESKCMQVIFEQHKISHSLQPYLSSLFYFKKEQVKHSIERMVPDGHIYLIFEFDGAIRHTYDNETLLPTADFSRVWIAGMQRGYISISEHHHAEMMVVQFATHGAYPFLHCSVDGLTEKILPAEIVFGKEVLKIREQIKQAPRIPEKFDLMEHWLSTIFDDALLPPPELSDFIDQLKAESFHAHTQLVKEYSHSQKHLIDQFKKYVGLKPKYLHRIYRFNEILAQIRHREKISWASIAYHCGYADQSHFIKEFRHFCGFNPSQFMVQDYDLDNPNFFPLDPRG